MSSQNIRDIFADLGIKEANDALAWRPNRGDVPIIVGTVISATVQRPEGKATNIQLSVRDHEGAAKTVYCPAVLGRGICGQVGLDWAEFKASEPTEELRVTVGAISGRFVCIRYLGREESEKGTHLYDLFLSDGPADENGDFVATAYEKLRADLPPECWHPVRQREAKINDGEDL